ncbi:uncharacterized protein ISCGN_009456 [Ixodes scapularis]
MSRTAPRPYGLGAVLAQREASGEERPIAFASRSLVAAERNYSQLDKEALAMVFGVTRFKQYLWGRSFEAATDHKLLLGLLAADKPIPELCSPRILRWALFLSGYDYTLKYRPGGQMMTVFWLVCKQCDPGVKQSSTRSDSIVCNTPAVAGDTQYAAPMQSCLKASIQRASVPKGAFGQHIGAQGGADQSNGSVENALGPHGSEAVKRAPPLVEVGGKQKHMGASRQ